MEKLASFLCIILDFLEFLLIYFHLSRGAGSDLVIGLTWLINDFE